LSLSLIFPSAEVKEGDCGSSADRLDRATVRSESASSTAKMAATRTKITIAMFSTKNWAPDLEEIVRRFDRYPILSSSQ
jgi:hypothetical protein